MTTSTLLRPRSIVEIVDAAFGLCRLHYPAFAAATAVILLPALVLRSLLTGPTAYLADILQNLLLPLADGATIALVSDAYLGRPVRVANGLHAVAGRTGSLLVTSIVRGVLAIIGFFLLVIPGLIVIAWTFAMPMVIVLEGQRSGAAFERSRNLVRGHTARVLGALALGLLFCLVVIVIMGLVIGVAESVLRVGERALAVVMDASFILAYPVLSVVATLLYYDLRIRKEGFDLAVMARELGEAEGTRSAARAPTEVP
jgi:hypothetical protein